MDVPLINQFMNLSEREISDQLAYLIDISHCDSQSTITQTVLEGFKDLLPADIWSSTKHLVQETEIWKLRVRI